MEIKEIIDKSENSNISESTLFALEKVRDVQIQIMEEIVRICDRENLNYFLMFGTLLGAVRHAGFIPWDDDVDLGMMRHDYDKFIRAFNEYGSDDFELQTTETDAYYQFFFLKVLKKDSTLIEGGYQDVRKKNKIFVDIFPFDKAPNNLILQKVQRSLVIFFKSLLFYKVDRISLSEGGLFVRAIRFCKMLLSKLFSRKMIIGIVNFLMGMVKKNTDWVSNFGDKDIYPKGLLDQYQEIPFNGYKFNAPLKSRELLEYIYGDYMKLPPFKNRILPHKITRVIIDGESIL